MSELPILYTFRRCPYAMRARMALWVSGTTCEWREVKLADKPDAMLEASEKGSVPVVVLPGGEVIDESEDVMRWALAHSDPEGWLERDDAELVERIDGPFKHHLDRYKYTTRYDSNGEEHRAAGMEILRDLNALLGAYANLSGAKRGLTDIAIFPFVRQFANTDREWFDAQPLADLHSWLERHLESSLFKDIMGKKKPWQPGDEVVLFGPEAA